MALRLTTLLLLALAALPLAAQETTFTPYVAKVSGDSVRLRSGPSLAHPPVHVFAKDEEVTVVGEKDGWATVRLPAEAPCWIASEFVKLNDQGTAYTVTGSKVNLRVSPDTKYFPVGQSDKDETLTAVMNAETDKPEVSEGFVKVIPPKSAHGAVSIDFIVKVKNLAPEKEEAEAAETAQPEPKREPTPEELDDERKTFIELEKMLDEELSKPSAEVDLTGIRMMFEQFEECALDKTIREKSKLYIDKIDLTVKLIETEKARLAEDDAERKAELERIREDALKKDEEKPEQPKGPVEYLTTGTVGSHGKTAKTPASHRLFDADGKVIYDMRWDEGDLGKYMGSKVGIVGKVKKYDGWPHKVVIIERIDVIDDGESK